MKNFNKLILLLTPYERKKAGLLMIMMFVMALLDMIGVASILPFMAVLTNPEIIESNVILDKMYKASTTFGVENNQDFLFALGILVFIILVFSLTFKAITTYVQIRFVLMREYSVSKRLMRGYLSQTYSWFLNLFKSNRAKRSTTTYKFCSVSVIEYGVVR